MRGHPSEPDAWQMMARILSMPETGTRAGTSLASRRAIGDYPDAEDKPRRRQPVRAHHHATGQLAFTEMLKAAAEARIL
jgi:hypothetical protein